MKINLGSGWRPIEGWLNVDLYSETADLRQDLRTLNFAPETVDEVLASHVIEHFVHDEGAAIATAAYSWLKPGGRLVVEMPNLESCLKLATSKVLNKALNGLKGICGGRNTKKPEWDKWMLEHRDQIIAEASRNHSATGIIPDEWRTAGYDHFYVWSAEEFADLLRPLGAVVKVGGGTIHGHRYGRDFRVVAIKP
jgi:SAM-dependent methyltransferase